MLSANNRIQDLMVAILMMATFAKVAPVAAEDAIPPDPPGWTQGTGTFFTVPDSPYLPVTLNSSAGVTLTLSSVPEIVDLMIAPDASAGSAEFTFSGFAANTLYYRYADNGLNPETFTTDAAGSFTYTQDLSAPHHVWFRNQPSTIHINATDGGGCTSPIGTWNPTAKTCTLTQDVTDAILIENDGITLDGNGHQASAPGNTAINSGGHSNLTIKNLTIASSSIGIYISGGSNNTVINNTILGAGSYGIALFSSHNNTVSGNLISDPGSSFGIIGFASDHNAFADNTVSNTDHGINLSNGSNNTVSGNTTSGAVTGIFFGADSNANAVSGNTVENSASFGLSLQGNGSSNNQIYNNNFINNPTQIVVFNSGGGSGNTFNQAPPIGGNYFSNLQGCNDTNSDGFCDAPYGFGGGTDNYPWTTLDGWVSNAAPTLGDITIDTALVPVNTPFNASASFTDLDTNDTHTAAWHWGDGATTTGTISEANGNGSVNDSHSYSSPGVYTVALTVTDNDEVDSNVSQYKYVVVYDPSGGFVTGGGWINSPAGAYVANPTAIGKAEFGFVAKYKKGATVPSGETEFQLSASQFHFHSTSYQWLVVSGAKAQFEGQGIIEGSNHHYGLMLTATDGKVSGGGGVDKFRIKIWDMDNGDAVVYDNQMDGEDDANPSTAIGKGSIVIHK